MSYLNKKTLSAFALASTCLLGINTHASAALIVSASTEFDTANSFGDTSGTLSITNNGTSSTGTFAGDSVTNNPSLTNLIAGAIISNTAQVANTNSDEFVVGIDTEVSLENTHASNIYEVIFQATVNNQVQAFGNDAYVDSELTIDNGPDELLFSDLVSDTFFGDEVGGTATGSFGALLTDVNSQALTFTLNPSDMIDLDISYTLEGEGFDGTTFADFSFALELSSISITNATTNPPPTPASAPATLAILTLGLGLAGVRRRFK